MSGASTRQGTVVRRALLAMLGLLFALSARAQHTASIPMGTFNGAASGLLANGVSWTVDRGSWHARQGYIIYPPQTQTWTFSPEVDLRFGIAGLNGGSECMVLPAGVVVEAISPLHTWNLANRTVCRAGSGETDTSFFRLDNTSTLTLQAISTNGYGRGVTLIEATVDTLWADLSIDKSVAPAAAAIGDAVSYTLVVTNHGPVAANGAVVTDPGAPGMSCTSLNCGSATGGAVCPAAPTPVQLAAGLAIPTFPANGSVTLTLGCTMVTP